MKSLRMLRNKLAEIASILLVLTCLLLTPSVSAKFIAVSVISQDNFRNLITDQIEKAVDEYMDDVYIDFADGDANYQLKQVQSYIDAGADAVIVLASGDKDINIKLVELSSRYRSFL